VLNLFVLIRRLCSPFAAALALFSLCMTTTAIPLSPSGKVVAVVQATTASGPGGRRTLSVAKPIYSGDTIRTGAVGNAQLQFLDDTRFVIGPKSNVIIDKYVFNPDRTLAGASITMARGAFRFMSGKGPSRAYKIRTPSATIGIRGTQVDVAVGGQLGTAVLVFQGAVQLCNRGSGQCRLVRSGCGAAIARPNGSVGVPRRGADKAALIRSSFPLTTRQNRLPRNFRVNTNGCGLDAPASPSPQPQQRSQRATFTPDPADRSAPAATGGQDAHTIGNPQSDTPDAPGSGSGSASGGTGGGTGGGGTGGGGGGGGTGGDGGGGGTGGGISGGGGNDGGAGGAGGGTGGDGNGGAGAAMAAAMETAAKARPNRSSPLTEVSVHRSPPVDRAASAARIHAFSSTAAPSQPDFPPAPPQPDRC